MADEAPVPAPSDTPNADAESAAEGLRTSPEGPLFEYADDVALRDELTGAQSSGTRAAQMSGEHFSRLLYGPGADAHISPYGVPPVPNSLDSREK